MNVRLHDGRLLLTTCFTIDNDNIFNGSPIVSREVSSVEQFLDAVRSAYYRVRETQHDIKFQFVLSNFDYVF